MSEPEALQELREALAAALSDNIHICYDPDRGAGCDHRICNTVVAVDAVIEAIRGAGWGPTAAHPDSFVQRLRDGWMPQRDETLTYRLWRRSNEPDIPVEEYMTEAEQACMARSAADDVELLMSGAWGRLNENEHLLGQRIIEQLAADRAERDAALQEVERLERQIDSDGRLIGRLTQQIAGHLAEVASLRAALREKDGVPTEQLRAMIRLLYPEEMTPTAKRQLEAVCAVHEAAGASHQETGGPEYEQMWVSGHPGVHERDACLHGCEREGCEPVFRKVTPEATQEEEA